MATATELIERVEEAFADLKLGEGVSLHEAFVIDCYGTDEERAAARQKDEHHDWRKLIDSKLLCGLALCFMDDAGMRFHLPACLVTALRPESTNFDVAYDSLLFHLTRKGSVNLFAFSVVEIQLILEIMLLLRERTPNHLLEKSSRCIENLRSILFLIENSLNNPRIDPMFEGYCYIAAQNTIPRIGFQPFCYSSNFHATSRKLCLT